MHQITPAELLAFLMAADAEFRARPLTDDERRLIDDHDARAFAARHTRPPQEPSDA